MDEAEFAAAVEAASAETIDKQLKAGVAIINDGEQGRESFFTYVQHRMSGFGGASARFRRALEGRGGHAEAFMTSPSPGIIAAAMENAHYASLEDYIDALAAALTTEYQAIAEAGLVLPIDAPDLVLERHPCPWAPPPMWSGPSSKPSCEGAAPASQRLF